MQEQQGQEVSRQTATGSPGRIYHWHRLWRLRNSIWSVNPIKMRNTITSRRECLLWHGLGHFPPLGTLLVKPNYTKNKLRREQGNWGVLLEEFPLPAPLRSAPPQGRNKHTWQRDENAQNVFPPRTARKTPNHVLLFLFSVAALPKASSLVSSKCIWDTQKGLYGQINQRNAG